MGWATLGTDEGLPAQNVRVYISISRAFPYHAVLYYHAHDNKGGGGLPSLATAVAAQDHIAVVRSTGNYFDYMLPNGHTGWLQYTNDGNVCGPAVDYTQSIGVLPSGLTVTRPLGTRGWRGGRVGRPERRGAPPGPRACGQARPLGGGRVVCGCASVLHY